MADYDSSLPIRSEADLTDERVHVKIVDSIDPNANQGRVTSNGDVNVEVAGKNPSSGRETLLLSELGAPNPDGYYDASFNTRPGHVGIIGHSRVITPGNSNLVIRVTAKQGTVSPDDDVKSLDVSIHDGNGNRYDESNPLPVYQTDSPGEDVLDYNTTASLAKSATTDHDYSVGVGGSFNIKGLIVSGSGKLKAELQLVTGGVPATKFVGFNSTASPQIIFDFSSAPYTYDGGASNIVRIVITNLDNSPQDVYSTLYGTLSA